MTKRLLVYWDNFLYKFLIKNLLKTSKLGYGFVVSGAESGENFERIYNNRPEGAFLIGRQIDKVLLNLPAVQATRARKDEIKNVLWNEIENNQLNNIKTRVLDLASGGARYIRELHEEHGKCSIESICIDKNKVCVELGRNLIKKEHLENVRFFRGDIFKLSRLKKISEQLSWTPNVVIASGLFIYFNDKKVEQMLKEIYELLPTGGLVIFQSYEQLNTRKLMRKTMSTSSGEEWTLYYRKPKYWRALLHDLGFRSINISQDRWKMNNICSARK